MSNRILYQTIIAAKSGDSEAMAKILSHYKACIRRWATRGNYVDESICQAAEAKLMYAVFKFDVGQKAIQI